LEQRYLGEKGLEGGEMRINTKSVYFFYLSISQNGDGWEGMETRFTTNTLDSSRGRTHNKQKAANNKLKAVKNIKSKMKVNKKMACLRMQD
jgi:hypothetical protein